jgi:peptidoglycan/LPS O-acetylase OafA/YrhL
MTSLVLVIKKVIQKHRRIFGTVGAMVALVIMVAYIFITPKEADSTVGFQKAILIYAHSMCWLLLGIASFLWSGKNKNNWPKYLAYTALGIYFIFIITLISS